MRAFRSLVAAFAGLAVVATSVLAHSTQRNPLSYVSLLEKPVVQTPGRHVHALSRFDLTFSLHNRKQKVRLALEPNDDIVPENAQVVFLDPEGNVRNIETIDRAAHKVFRGHAFVKRFGHTEWTNVGWARITVHRDGEEPIFEGAFRIDGDHHHIQTGANYRKLQHEEDPDVTVDLPAEEFMVVWRDSDILPNFPYGELKRSVPSVAPSCNYQALQYNQDTFQTLSIKQSLHSMSWRSLFARDGDTPGGTNPTGLDLSNTIGQTAGCPTTRKVALAGIAADCTYAKSFNSTESMKANIIQQINSASQVYESTFNISLAIMNLTLADPNCPGTASAAVPWNVDCSDSTTITDRLNLFSDWRGRNKDSNAYWTLLSTCNTEAAVGLAWLGQVCVPGASTSGNQSIAAANVVVKTSTEWQVIAHETGHTFGAVHDCVPETCSDGTEQQDMCCPLSTSTCDAGGQYIMNPATGANLHTFSPCSVGNICSAIGRNAVRTTCLTSNKDVTTYTGSQCGNGIVEPGEDCDCGGAAGCGSDKCCDPTTCKFVGNAVCDPSNEDCCTPQCQLATSGTVCRASTGFCDPQEVCNGTSPMCPPDDFEPDGTGCGASGAGLACASGQCTSRDQQCQAQVGIMLNSNDTSACSDSGCVLACSSGGQYGGAQCVTMNQNYLDGTPCQGGGKCYEGACDGSSISNEIAEWFRDNKGIAIPVAVIVGVLIILSLVSCCYSACQRRRGRRAMAAAINGGGGAGSGAPGWGGWRFGSAKAKTASPVSTMSGGAGGGGWPGQNPGPGPGGFMGPSPPMSSGANGRPPMRETSGPPLGPPPPYPSYPGNYPSLRPQSTRYA